MKTHTLIVTVTAFIAGISLANIAAAAAAEAPAFRNAALPVEQRVEDLLGRLSVEEKAALCHGDAGSSKAPGDRFLSGGVPRLGISKIRFADGPVGMRTFDQSARTALPSTLLLSCTWDRDAARDYAGVLAGEMRASGAQVLFGPGLNMMRDPRGGRNFEYMGEDPFLCGALAVEYVKGLQTERVAACVKHFVANEHDKLRHFSSSNLSERTLREIYYRPFEMALTEGGAWSLMTGNNLVNGTHVAANRALLQDLLKERTGFDGVILTDWRSAYDTVPSALAGLDMTTGMCAYVYGEGNLLKAVRDGAVPETVLNEMTRRVLRLYARTGLLDAAPPEAPAMNLPAHAATARRIAAGGMVLLKNDRDLLPLDAAKIKALAVTGPGAEYIAYGRGSGEVHANPASMITPLQGIMNLVKGRAGVFHFAWNKMPARTPWEQSATKTKGKDKAGNKNKTNGKQPKKEAEVAETPSPSSAPALSTKPEITDAARARLAAADAVIFCAVDIPHGEGGDLDDIKLPWRQVEAIRELAAINPNIIVVLQIGQPVLLDEIADKVPSMLVAWYAGQATGGAVADVLFGKTNPSGKLSSTFARAMKDYPCEALGVWPPRIISDKARGGAGTTSADRKATHAVDADYKEGVFLGYRWFDKQGTEPLFAFGHGLSYTKFAMSDFKIEQGGISPKVSCVVANTGQRAGSEVVQVYVAPPKGAGADANAKIERPVRELKGFARVTLQPGESKRVEIALPEDALNFFDEKEDAWGIVAGEYFLEIGSSSRDIKARLPLAPWSSPLKSPPFTMEFENDLGGATIKELLSQKAD